MHVPVGMLQVIQLQSVYLYTHSSHILLLPLQLVYSLLHLVDPLTEGIVGGGPLSLQLEPSLLNGVVDALSYPNRGPHLSICSRRVMGGVGHPLIRSHYAVRGGGGEGFISRI